MMMKEWRVASGKTRYWECGNKQCQASQRHSSTHKIKICYLETQNRNVFNKIYSYTVCGLHRVFSFV